MNKYLIDLFLKRSASPIKHVTYSNDGTLFATASQVENKCGNYFKNKNFLLE